MRACLPLLLRSGNEWFIRTDNTTARFSCESYLTSTTVSLDRVGEGATKRSGPILWNLIISFTRSSLFRFCLIIVRAKRTCSPSPTLFPRLKFIRIILTKLVNSVKSYSSSKKTINFIYKNLFYNWIVLRKYSHLYRHNVRKNIS